MSKRPASLHANLLPRGPLALRGYQRRAVGAAQIESRPGRRIMLVLPTGSGKSWIIAAIAEAKGKQILIITPRRRLLVELRKYLREHGVVSGPIGNDLGEGHQLIVGTYQTMIRRKLIEPDVIIIDECHLVPPDSEYEKLLSRYPKAEIIGLTATPVRDDQHIACFGWKTVFEVGMVELIRDGYLVPPRSVGTDGLRVPEGDDGGDDRDGRTAKIIPKLMSKVEQLERYKCLLFCSSIDHAEHTVRLLRDAGEGAAYIVHSDQSILEQDRAMRGFEQTKGRSWLVNVSLVGIGVDIPAVDAVVILRNVGSLATGSNRRFAVAPVA